MINNCEILVEGSYNYLQQNKLYSTENFKLSRRLESHALFFEAEILSRIETGEFLKVMVFYELADNKAPCIMRIEKSLGERYSLETFEVSTTTQELTYTFTSEGETKTLRRHHSPKHYLSSPAVSTSAVFSLTKKFDSTTRTPLTLVAGHHSWKFDEATPVETIVYAEFNNRETIDLNINGQELHAQCLSLFSSDSLSGLGAENRVDLMLSKHYSIPYALIDDKIRVEIKQLKKLF